MTTRRTLLALLAVSVTLNAAFGWLAFNARDWWK